MAGILKLIGGAILLVSHVALAAIFAAGFAAIQDGLQGVERARAIGGMNHAALYWTGVMVAGWVLFLVGLMLGYSRQRREEMNASAEAAD